MGKVSVINTWVILPHLRLRIVQQKPQVQVEAAISCDKFDILEKCGKQVFNNSHGKCYKYVRCDYRNG